MHPIVLIGFSLGGYIASYVATKLTERIKVLFFISNSPCPFSSTELNERENTRHLVRLYAYGEISANRAASMLDARSSDNSKYHYKLDH
ncbi:MAG: 2-succinyl-6-hydroxy-2,4-cyclohexadiene-1-carboxylate synthase [Lentisphaeria bacterium]|jgi:2-succinyl-6-hydroxy-2,4-cyclohexadiene-1-carboxylate synthase